MNISKSVRDRAISSEFLTRRVVQDGPMQKGKIFNFRHFWRPSWIFAENEKGVNISKTVRDRAISSQFLTHRVVQECPMQKEKISIFATFGGHLGF